MGWLTELESPTLGAQGRSPWDDHWWGASVAPRSESGIQVTPESALTLSAVWSAVRIITQDLGGMRCILYENQKGGGKLEAVAHPLHPVLKRKPNAWQTAMEFYECVLGHMLLRGNAYVRILPGPSGFADQLVPLHPDRVRPEVRPTGRMVFVHTREDGRPETFTEDEIAHFRGLTTDGRIGMSVIAYGARSMGAAMAADSYAARFFAQGAAPAAVLTHEKTLGKDARQNLRTSIGSFTAGLDRAHKFLLLEEGMTWTQVGISPEDSQLIGTREFGVEDVARWFNMPLSKLRSNTKAQTFASAAEFNREYVASTLRPWAVRSEQVIERDLILDPDRFFAMFDMETLARGSARERAAVDHMQIVDGVVSRQEVRARWNMNPGPPALETYLEPLNMQPAGAPQEGHAAPPPSPVSVRAREIATGAAARIVRKEITSARKAATRFASDGEGWRGWLRTFYGGHADMVAETMRLRPSVAREYCARQGLALEEGGIAALEDWEATVPSELVAMALVEE